MGFGMDVVGARRGHAPSACGLLVADLGQRVARGCGCSRRAGRPASRPVPASPPASFASRTSRDGRVARLLTPSASIARVPSTPPVTVTMLVRPGRIEDGLGRRRLVVAERDRRRPDEERPEGLPDRVLGGDPHQAVLDDAVGHVLLAQGAADLRDLLDGEAAVLGDDQRPAAGELPRAARRRSPVWPRWAWVPSCSAHGRCAAVARHGPETATPLRRRLFGWPDSQGRCPPRGWLALILPRRARRRPRSRPSRRPIRSGGSSPDRHAPRGRGLRAQAVSGGPSSSVVATRRRPMAAAVRRVW